MLNNSGANLSRRIFLTGAAAATLNISLSDWLAAQGSPTARPKRSEVATPTGRRMLALYARAVAEMKDVGKWPLYHPFNWNFQANIHDYPDNTDIDRIFDIKQGKTGDEKKAIARYRALAMGTPGQVRIWKTCSHYGYSEHFLTWHRMQVYFFERIIEKIVGEPFALPYWSYAKSTQDQGRRMLPPEFRAKSIAGSSNPLYFEARTEEITTVGIRTDNEASHQDAFGEHTWLSTRNRNGFSGELEGTPHGSVHVAVGTTEGMGDTPKAARDPVFWVHHSNIDRLWESWRRPGADGKSGRDTTAGSPDETSWKQHNKFAFAGPATERIEMSIDDALRASKMLGIEYDSLESVPVAMAFAGDPDQVRNPTTLSKATSPVAPKITEKNSPVTVTLSPAVDPPVALGFAGRAETRYSLIIEAEASTSPGAAYDVYLKILKTPGSAETVDQLIKTFNFFSAPMHATNHQAPKVTWEADITELVRDKRVDPRSPGQLTFRARYATPKVPVSITSYRIEAH
jgi:tyrosinase